MLAPKSLWQPHLKKRPGLRTLQIEESVRADGLPGKCFVTVQPSTKYAYGVFFDVNNELEGAESGGTSQLIGMINDHWPRLTSEAKKMAEGVLAGALL